MFYGSGDLSDWQRLLHNPLEFMASFRLEFNSCLEELKLKDWMLSPKVNHAWDKISASKCKLMKLKHENVLDELFAARNSEARMFRLRDETCCGAELMLDTEM